jgi:hypothetical protein
LAYGLVRGVFALGQYAGLWHVALNDAAASSTEIEAAGSTTGPRRCRQWSSAATSALQIPCIQAAFRDQVRLSTTPDQRS